MTISIFYGYLINLFIFSNIEVVFLNSIEKLSIIIICRIFIIINKLINKIINFKIIYFLKFFLVKYDFYIILFLYLLLFR
ncbi:putative membrane protein [Wolbachia pipientis wVitA]|nr:putative membrane protein [Wolbachia pipientis wVitA]